MLARTPYDDFILHCCPTLAIQADFSTNVLLYLETDCSTTQSVSLTNAGDGNKNPIQEPILSLQKGPIHVEIRH
jgi:hypothetical protein